MVSFGCLVFKRRILSFSLIRIFFPFFIDFISYFRYKKQWRTIQHILWYPNPSTKNKYEYYWCFFFTWPLPLFHLSPPTKSSHYPDLHDFHSFVCLYNNTVYQTSSCFVWKVLKLYKSLYIFCILIFAVLLKHIWKIHVAKL